MGGEDDEELDMDQMQDENDGSEEEDGLEVCEEVDEGDPNEEAIREEIADLEGELAKLLETTKRRNWS